MRGQIDEFAGTETNQDFLERDIMNLRELFAQPQRPPPSRIAMRFGKHAAVAGFMAFGERAKRIFIGREFDRAGFSVRAQRLRSGARR